MYWRKIKTGKKYITKRGIGTCISAGKQCPWDEPYVHMNISKPVKGATKGEHVMKPREVVEETT